VAHDDPGLRSIVFDCRDAWSQANWWAETIAGYRVDEFDEEDMAWAREHWGIEGMEDVPTIAIRNAAGGPTIWFNKVPEPKVGKARIHIDVNVDSVEAIDRLIERGATILRPLGAVAEEPWAIMADPEGNEFCAFPPRSQAPGTDTAQT